jgi:predicted transposase/invertase (TIGR01784 family)
LQGYDWTTIADPEARFENLVAFHLIAWCRRQQDEEARMIYEAELKQPRDDRARMRGALEKGIALDKAEGEAEGEKKGPIEIAKKLLHMGMPLETIIQAADLPHEETVKLSTD